MIQQEGGKKLTSRKLAAFLITLLLAFFLCATSAWCSDDFINSDSGYGVGIWWTTVYGDVKYGSTLNLRGDLGLKQGQPAINLDAEWNFNDKWGAVVNYFYVKQTGASTAGRSQIFNGAQILTGDRMNSSLTVSTASFMAKYNLYRSEDSLLDVQAGGKLLSTTLNITKAGNINPVLAPAFNFSLKPTVSFMPAIGLSGKQRIAERIHVYGDFTGMFDVGQSDVKQGWLTDFKAGLRYNFQHPGWYLTLDYRYFGTWVERNNGNHAKINWNGPAVSIRYEF